MAFFFVDRLVARSAILDVFATKSQRTLSTNTCGFLLGLLEDLLVATMLLVALAIVEALAVMIHWVDTHKRTHAKIILALGRGLGVVVVMGLAVLAVAPFAADMLLLRVRSMRFTTDLIVTYTRERDQAKSLEVDPREVKLAIATCVGVGMFAVLFTTAYVRWIDLRGALFAPRHLGSSSEPSKYRFEPVASSPHIESGDLEMAIDAQSDNRSLVDASPPSDSNGADDETEGRASERSLPSDRQLKQTSTSWWSQFPRSRVAVVFIVGWIVLFVIVQAIATSASPVVAAIALNATLNELFRNLFHIQFQRGSGSGDIMLAASYLNPATENYELFEPDVLFRKTTGFKGPLVFDVQVEQKDPLNVLVVAVESFRYLDSLLLAGKTADDRLRKHNITLTPNFDRWAKSGVAFNNMWSSWQTSRSLEAILFGQVAYDSVTDSGTTRGRKDTKLVGMPQLFKQKGYETMFTTGTMASYDQWDTFLPSHGFDSIMDASEMKLYAEKHYNIAKSDWNGPARRAFYWGIHDDVSFEIVGDLIIKKTQEQAARVSRGEKKQPFFLNHYTISSHGSFDARPAWYDSERLPDFSPICDGWESKCALLKDYAKMRYFTDLQLGKFLDRMEAHGVLEDTLVVIVGDHGQGPEMGIPMSILYQTAATHVASALIAVGRLGKYAGTMIEDATHHYDLLNTLADIVGVPDEGFFQTGVGRSLKRAAPFGERVVWSNNPMKKMSAVRGHERFVYDRASDDTGLFDTVQDPLEKTNLLSSRSSEEQAKWEAIKAAGRELNAYFMRRWDHKCLAAVAC